MGDMPLRLDDDTVVWLRAEPVGAAAPAPAPPAVPQPQTAEPDLELPEGYGAARPVSVDSRMSRALTRGGAVLEDALRPLGGVLGQIHRSIAGADHRPDEVTVQFGVTLGSDLNLGVFAGKGEASFTVSATWNLGRHPDAPPERGDVPAPADGGGGGPEPGGAAP